MGKTKHKLTKDEIRELQEKQRPQSREGKGLGMPKSVHRLAGDDQDAIREEMAHISKQIDDLEKNVGHS